MFFFFCLKVLGRKRDLREKQFFLYEFIYSDKDSLSRSWQDLDQVGNYWQKL